MDLVGNQALREVQEQLFYRTVGYWLESESILLINFVEKLRWYKHLQASIGQYHLHLKSKSFRLFLS
jgi:hypothetical protein